MDARFFNANNVAASAGLLHTYEAMQDLIFDFYANYTRQTDIFNSALQFNNNAIGPPATPNVSLPVILNPFGTTPAVNPIAYNQLTGAASVTKTFDQAFVTLRGTAFDIVYDKSDNVPAPFQTSHDGAQFLAFGKGRVQFPNLLRVCSRRWDFSTFRQFSVQHEWIQSYWGCWNERPKQFVQG